MFRGGRTTIRQQHYIFCPQQHTKLTPLASDFRRVNTAGLTSPLHQSEALRALDGLQQLVAQLLGRGVLREVEQVEAGVGDRKEGVTAAGRLDVQLDRLHARDGHPVGAGQEQQELLLLLQRQRVEHLTTRDSRWRVTGRHQHDDHDTRRPVEGHRTPST